MATEHATAIEGRSVSRLLGVAITDTELKRFVKMSAASTVILATSGSQVEGIVQSIGASGDVVPVAISGEYLVEVGSGGITLGDDVMSDGTGKAVVLTALSATVPTGATPVTSTGANPAMTMAGGALPSKKAGVAVDTAAENGFARIRIG